MKISIKEMTMVSIFTALTAIGAFISIPLGPVPMTMQTLFVSIGFLVLGGKLSALGQLLYIFLGFIGLPIFSGFTSGIQSIFSPSFGFIIGFVFASYIAGSLLHRGELTNKRILLWTIIGNILIYIVGLAYMYVILNFYLGKDLDIINILYLGLIPFLPGDLLKMTLAFVTSKKLLNILNSKRLGSY